MSENPENGISLNTCEISRIIDNLESKSYLKTNFNGLLAIDNMEIRIREFTNWLNSTFRINLLKENVDKEVYLFLLLNLKKNIRSAISEINQSSMKHKYKFKCNKCHANININNNRFWDCIENHEHCEELLLNGYDNITDNVEITTINSPTKQPINHVKVQTDNINPSPITNKTITNNKPAGLNDFKFNFEIKYHPQIQKLFYPDGLMKTARHFDKLTEYTIQLGGSNHAVCLLCRRQITRPDKVRKVSPSIITSHVSGQKHLRLASDKAILIHLKNYHDFWKGQEFKYQTHQVHFLPSVGQKLPNCHLCKENLPYDKIIEHIKNDGHKMNFTKFICSEDGRNSDLYLVEIQMSIYCNNENVNGHVPVAAQPKPIQSTSTTIPTTSSPIKTKPTNKNKDKLHKPKNSLYCVVVKSELTFKNDGTVIFPDRFKKHESFFVKTNDLIKCNLCNLEMSCDLKTISLHIQTSKHKKSSNIVDKKYKFFCEICQFPCFSEDMFDKHFTQGPNRHGLIPENRKSHLTFYECRTCSIVIYGDEMSVNRHLTSANKSNKNKDDVKLPYKLKRLFASVDSIEEAANRLVIEANQVLGSKVLMRDCCNDLQKALIQLYPNCKAYPFGSRVSGSANINSDLDVFMDIGEMYKGDIKQDAESQEEIILKSAKILKGSREDFSYIVPISSARTPIIKLHHNFTNLDCDISFRHGLGIENTKFLRFCMELQPITQPFILLLKKWSDECRLKEYITNYAIALMAIFYLQITGYLLSVKVIRQFNPNPSIIIDGWETIDYKVPVDKMKDFVKPFTSNIKQLLQDFFNYFANFNYSNDVVCPLMGHTIAKMSFCEQPDKSLPLEMRTYLQKIQNNRDAEFRALSPFCIQDPFDLSHNLTKACPNSTVVKFKALCKTTYETLLKETEQ